MTIIEIKPAGKGRYSANPAERLAGAEFATYLKLARAAGLRFDAVQKRQVGGIETLPALIGEFQREGFALTVDPALAAAIKGDLHVAQSRDAHGRELAQKAEERAQERGLALYPFQREGVRWLAPRRRALLGDEMGLGKTVQALCAAGSMPALLVVAPALVKGNWKRETLKWSDAGMRVTVCSGRGSFRWPKPGEAVVINYDILPRTPAEADSDKGEVIEEIEAPDCSVTVVADEIHMVKNRAALRTTRFRAIVNAVLSAGGRAWGMSGTPLLNNPEELWNVLDTLELAEEAFGSWPNFVRHFGGFRGAHGMEWGLPSPDVPAMLRKVALVRRRIDVLPDLPRKMRTTIEVELDANTKRLCDEAVEQLASKGIDIETVSEIVDETRLAGADFDKLSRARAALAVAKLGAAEEVAAEYEAEGVPLIVFSAHTSAAEVLGSRKGWASITGSVSAARRTEIVDQFQRGELRGLVGTIQAMGVGVTLTRASHVLFVDLAWTPGLNSQAEDRVCRIGQEAEGITVKRLVGDHAVDYRVLELLDKKQAIIEGSVEASAVQVGESNDQAALANAERLQKAQAMARIFDSSNVVDSEEVERQRMEREEVRRAAREAAERAILPALGARPATAEQVATLDRLAMLNDPRAASLVRHARTATLSALEWAAINRLETRLRQSK